MIQTSFNAIGAAYAIAALLLVYAAPSVEMTWIIIVVSMLAAAIHMVLVKHSNDMFFWGNVKGSFFVIDRGTLPDDFELPDHLAGQYLFCSASNVRAKESWVTDKLVVSGNDYYEKGMVDVNIVYFRYGERCNESQEDYVKFLVEAIEEDRVRFQQSVLKMEEAGTLKRGTYEIQFLQSGLNSGK